MGGIVHLGGGANYPTHVRVAGINAPERRGRTKAAGFRALEYLASLLHAGTLSVQGVGSDLDRWGRVVANVAVDTGLPSSGTVGDAMVSSGHAVPWVG